MSRTLEAFDSDSVSQLEREYRRARVTAEQASEQLEHADKLLRRAYAKRARLLTEAS